MLSKKFASLLQNDVWQRSANLASYQSGKHSKQPSHKSTTHKLCTCALKSILGKNQASISFIFGSYHNNSHVPSICFVKALRAIWSHILTNTSFTVSGENEKDFQNFWFYLHTPHFGTPVRPKMAEFSEKSPNCLRPPTLVLEKYIAKFSKNLWPIFLTKYDQILPKFKTKMAIKIFRSEIYPPTPPSSLRDSPLYKPQLSKL